jgi:hypothetical protein
MTIILFNKTKNRSYSQGIYGNFRASGEGLGLYGEQNRKIKPTKYFY